MSGQGTFGKSPKVRNNRVIWTVNYIDYINLQKKMIFFKNVQTNRIGFGKYIIHLKCLTTQKKE